MSEQWTLPMEFRDFQVSDYERLAEVYSSIFPDYSRTASEWQHWDKMLEGSKYYFHRTTCVDRATGKILGFGQCQHAVEMFHPRKFWLEIWVDPKNQGKGVGRAIYDLLSREVADKEAITCWGMVREDMIRPRGFAHKRGFVEKRRAWESRINPSSFDPNPFRGYATKATGHGISFSTLSEQRKRDAEFSGKLHDLVNKITEDMPRPEKYTPIPYEQWAEIELNNPNLAPEGYMIALDGDKYVGLSALWKSQTDSRGLYQGNTGVLREYRGRGIAIALKLKVLNFAKEGGYELIKTWNDSENAPMLGINMKLGFQRQVGWIIFEKRIA